MREEISQSENEGEGSSREDSGKRERQNHAHESGERRRAEVVRGFDEVARHVFQRRVDRQESEWRVDVCQRENDRERAVEKKLNRTVSDVQILQKSIEHTFAAQNGFPSVTADKVAGPQRNNYELVEQIFAFCRVKRKVVGERIAKQKGQECDRARDSDRAEK